MVRSLTLILGLWSQVASSHVALHLQAYQTVPSGLWEDAAAGYEQLIEKGIWDGGQLVVEVPLSPAPSADEQAVLQASTAGNARFHVSSRRWKALGSSYRRAVLRSLLAKLHTAEAYHIKVDHNASSWDDEELVNHLHPSLVPEPWYGLLSPFASYWQERLVDSSAEPNCLHAAIASVSQQHLPHAYMTEAKFECYLDHYFEEVDQAKQVGDLLVIYEGSIVQHAATFVGHGEPAGERIYFTKNGRTKGYYLYMNETSLREVLYPGGEARYFRRNLQARGSFGKRCR